MRIVALILGADALTALGFRLSPTIPAAAAVVLWLLVVVVAVGCEVRRRK